MQSSRVKIIVTIIIVGIGLAIIGVALYFNPTWPKNDSFDDKMFRRASNRTFSGFEKENNQKWKGDFFFIQAADPQFGLMEQRQNSSLVVASNWTHERELLRKAVEQWNELLPRFVVICGDLVNDTPSKKQTKRREQLDDLKFELSKLNSQIPLVLMGGNHDLENEPTKLALDAYKQEFGDDYYSFWVDSVMFIVLNSQLFANHSTLEHEYEQQNKWLDEQLKIAKDSNYTHLIVFQHIPWFLNDIKEDEDYFNIALVERSKIMKKFIDANVTYVFAGHYHRNAEGKYEQLNMITTSAIGEQLSTIDKSGYRRVNVTQNAIIHKYLDIETKQT